MQSVNVIGHGILNFPDDMTQDQMAEAIQRNFPDIHPQDSAQSAASDVPLVQGMQGYEQQQAAQQSQVAANPDPSLFEKIGSGASAIGRSVLAAPLALAGSVVGGVHGIGKSIADGSFGTAQGADMAAQTAAQDVQYFTAPAMAGASPLTQEYMGNIGEKLGALDPAMAGGSQGINLLAKPALAQIGESAISQGAKKAISNEAALVPKSIADVKSTAGGIMADRAKAEGAPLSRNEIPVTKKQETVNKILAGDTDNSLAPLELKIENPSLKDAKGNLLPEAYKVIEDPIAKETIKQGFNDGIVQAVKTVDRHNAKKMLDMINISEKGKKNAVYGSENRPTDVIGDSLAQNIQFAKRINREAGSEIDKAAKALEGKPVDVTVPVDSFVTDLADKVKVKIGTDQSGKVRADFRGSDIEGKMYAPEQRLITMIVDRMANTKAPDAYDVHRLKRAIDQTVVYGKSNSKALWPDVENSVKSLRKNLDSTLDENFESYNKANTKYSDTIQELDNFQKTAGNKIDLFGEGADKQLGILSRRLLSNVQSRQELANSIKSLQEVNRKYGNKTPDDIVAQITFANELDNMFGPAAKSSLAGEQSAGTKAALRDLSQSHGIYDLAARGVQKVADKARGVNQDAAYKSMRELLAKQARKKQQEATQ